MRLREQLEIKERRRSERRRDGQADEATRRERKRGREPVYVFNGDRLVLRTAERPVIEGDHRCPLCRKFGMGDAAQECPPEHFR